MADEKSKGMTPEQKAAVRAFIAEAAKPFDGKINPLADAMDVSQSQLSPFMKKDGGLGINSLVKIADYLGRSVDEIIGRSVDTNEPRHMNLPGWREGEAAVRAERDVPSWIWDKARRARGLAPPTGVTVEWVRDLVATLWKYMPREEQVAAENAILAKRVATQKKREDNKALRGLAPKNDAPSKAANDPRSKRPLAPTRRRTGAKPPAKNKDPQR